MSAKQNEASDARSLAVLPTGPAAKKKGQTRKGRDVMEKKFRYTRIAPENINVAQTCFLIFLMHVHTHHTRKKFSQGKPTPADFVRSATTTIDGKTGVPVYRDAPNP